MESKKNIFEENKDKIIFLFKEQYPEVVIELIETKKYKQIIKENKNNINFE